MEKTERCTLFRPISVLYWMLWQKEGLYDGGR